MQITRQQMAALERAQWQRFEDEMVLGLRESFGPTIAAHGLDDAGLRGIVREAHRHAAVHGIVSEPGVARFIEFVFEFGGGFESLPWAAPILASAALDGDDKIDHLSAVSAFSVR